MKKYKRLTKDERNQIEILHNLKYSNRKIAGVLRRSPNTISYEINRVPTGYRADYGQIYARKAEMNRRYQWRKLNHHSELNRYVIERLKRKWSPDVISGRMKEEGRNFFVSGKSIYSWLDCVEGERYQKHLYKNRTGRKKPGKRIEYLGIKGLVSIHERPKEIWNRQENFHWETDLVESNRSGTGALSTSSERISRYINAQYVINKTSCEKQKTLKILQSEFVVKSITFDRGTCQWDIKSSLRLFYMSNQCKARMHYIESVTYLPTSATATIVDKKEALKTLTKWYEGTLKKERIFQQFQTRDYKKLLSKLTINRERFLITKHHLKLLQKWDYLKI